MKKGKLIVIEGSDGAGKGTQTKALIEYLKTKNEKVMTLHFPNYDSPTGKIVGGPYLGHEEISKRFFEEPSSEIDPKIISLYYAADFKYNMDKLKKYLDEGTNIILDRYIESNMAYQGGLIENKEERLEMYNWIEKLNYEMLNIPKPDAVIYLYIPFEECKKQRNTRNEKLDAHEANDKHLLSANNAYLELSEIYNFKKIECLKDGQMRSIDDISNEVISIYENIK